MKAAQTHLLQELYKQLREYVSRDVQPLYCLPVTVETCAVVHKYIKEQINELCI